MQWILEKLCNVSKAHTVDETSQRSSGFTTVTSSTHTFYVGSSWRGSNFLREASVRADEFGIGRAGISNVNNSEKEMLEKEKLQGERGGTRGPQDNG